MTTQSQGLEKQIIHESRYTHVCRLLTQTCHLWFSFLTNSIFGLMICSVFFVFISVLWFQMGLTSL